MTDCRATIVEIVSEDLANNESYFKIITAVSVPVNIEYMQKRVYYD